jgi:hypothetical protein
MMHGSLRRSIALPDTSYGYSPDGLSETDIDLLLAQAGVDIDEPLMDQSAAVLSLRDAAFRSSDSMTGDEAA